MLADLIAITLILKAQNKTAARQFLHYLTVAKAPDEASFASDYPKMILNKAGALSSTDVRQWLWTVIENF